MWLAFLRKLGLMGITLIILSVISYHILLRDPLNQPKDGMFAGYYAYIQDLLRADLGVSEHTGESLVGQILTVFPATIVLCVSAMCLSLLLGIALGFLAESRRESLLGKLLISLGSLSLAIPVFWLAIIWVAYASLNGWKGAVIGEIHPIYYGVQSITGIKMVDIFLSDSPHKLTMMQSALQHLALPTLILAIPATLEIMRVTHKRTAFVLKQNYVKVARARGWSPCKVWGSLVLRNTLPSLIPAIAHTFTLIFAFGMLIENVVSWGGIGRWLINALAVQDYRAISAGIVAIGIFVLLIDLVANTLTIWLDPYHKKGWFNVT